MLQGHDESASSAKANDGVLKKTTSIWTKFWQLISVKSFLLTKQTNKHIPSLKRLEINEVTHWELFQAVFLRLFSTLNECLQNMFPGWRI